MIAFSISSAQVIASASSRSVSAKTADTQVETATRTLSMRAHCGGMRRSSFKTLFISQMGRSSSSPSGFANTRSASKLSFCHLTVASNTIARRMPLARHS